MKIHHYTSIETLELILKNRTIRFNRSDKVDDPDEIELEVNGLPFAKYLLVSCWSIEEEESIPQWSIYAGKSKGVRITLDSEHIFQDFIDSTRVSSSEKDITEKVWNKRSSQSNGIDIFPYPFRSNDNKISYIPHYIYHGTLNPTSSGLAILPPDPNRDFLIPIEYVDSMKNAYPNHIQIKHYENRHYSMRFTTRIGYKKLKSWSFQREARFVLLLMHTIPREQIPFNVDVPNFSFTHYGFPPLKYGKMEELTHYDISIDTDAFEYMEVIAGPETSQEDKNKINDLLTKYAPKAKYSESKCRTRFCKD